MYINLQSSSAYQDEYIFLVHLSQQVDFHLSRDPYDTAWRSSPYSPS